MIGLISDSHDNLPIVEKAVEELNRKEVNLVLHAGDYIAPFVVPKLRKIKARLVGVFGNNDGDRELLKERFNETDSLEMRGNFAEISAAGLRIGLLHGDDGELLKALIKCESFDVIVHGHTHEAKVYRRGKTLIVNPGEVCGYLSGRRTIALFDTGTRRADIVEL